MILSVDLAAKFSAILLLDDDGKVLWQGDSRDMSVFAFCDKIATLGNRPEVSLIVIEDVPYGTSNPTTKSVFRIQGALINALRLVLDKVVFVNPTTWQKEFDGLRRAPKGMTGAQGAAYRVEAARVAAEVNGYQPPNLVQAYIDALPEGTKVLKKHTSPLAKVQTDYVDAFLIAFWARSHLADIRTLSGVQEPLI